ncbi:hypothetical protein GH714_032471 [Hevea brasiliensis]|uniref:Uncharacterized protein n=1 Tax=Hevea brasiliensis TaxID=3981 RepID=A0A6A6L1W0_HEVBR|nr:hypothetical protein GH714_032471 [Hevea brasiliensis]
MTDFQPLQQKPESTDDARAEFERGLEELMRGHLDDCMSFAACSSTRNADEEDDEGDQLVRRRRRSDLEGDLAESSAARRRHSRILSRWAARQAQEMITTIERRNLTHVKEARAVERPSTQASAILQMWRELEDEHLLNRARERVRERLRQQRSVESNTNMSSTNMSESRGSENQGSLVDASESENEFVPWSHERLGAQNEHGIIMGLGVGADGKSAAGGRGGWREEQAAGLDAQVDRVRDGSAADHDEGQPEHIRRDMLRLRGRQALLDLLVRIERERQRELQGLLEHRAVSDFAHRNRIQSLLRGRFLRNERPVEEERPPSMAASELVQLRQRHTVSGLRCIQLSLIDLENLSSDGFHYSDSCRGIFKLSTFMRKDSVLGWKISSCQVSGHSDSTPDSNVNDPEMIGVRQTLLRISNLKTVNNCSLEVRNDTHRLSEQTENLQSNAAANNMNWQETANQVGAYRWELARESVNDWPQETPGNVQSEQSRPQDAQRGWHQNGSREAVENWTEGPSDPPRMRRAVPMRRYNRFHPPDDDNVYSMELRELLSRRSVSNLLRSFP